MSSHNQREEPSGKYLRTLSMTALGIVYGDIGTSPLYAMRECFNGPHGVEPSPENVFGVLSLITWSLVFVVTIKYMMFVMRADNRGEGGIIALMSLASSKGILSDKLRVFPLLLGLFGAALFYGDGMITPAISVLSAIEGLVVATPSFEPYVIPITILILVGLFSAQRFGTAKVGAVFGPVVLVWFAALSILGVSGIVENPVVLKAVNPWYALEFFLRNQWHGFLVLGAVFLVATGGEALYADMGHFGKKPIRLAWFAVVLPALLLNYYGQGGLIIGNPAAANQPFFNLAPSWALYPLVIIATCATVIASQAVISGAFSLTRQAVHMGFLPRVRIIHTSETEIGQIYVPVVNTILMVAVIGLVVGFKESGAVAAAYGVAVSTDMVITTVLFFIVARYRWHWKLSHALALVLVFWPIDLAFFGANIIKLGQGAWLPLAVAAVAFTLMSIWKKGRSLLWEKIQSDIFPLALFLEDVARHPERRVPGTAVFMTSSAEGTPRGLLHNLKHNKIIHSQVVLLTVLTEEMPRVAPSERIRVEKLGEGFWRVLLHYGFIENPRVALALETFEHDELKFDMMTTSFYLSRETLFPTRDSKMSFWQERIFIWLSRNALSPTYYFGLPPNRVVELGAHVEL